MNIARCVALALALSVPTLPAAAAADYFWNCTAPNGVKYADASKCDKGDTAVKVMKDHNAASAPSSLVRATLSEEKIEGLNPGACPSNPGYCALHDYGVTDGTPRTQAVTQFMRKRECDFAHRFPERCLKPR